MYQEYTGVRIPSYYLRAIREKSVFHSPIRRGSYVGNTMRELWFHSLLNFRVATDPWYHPVSYHMRHSPHRLIAGIFRPSNTCQLQTALARSGFETSGW